MPIGETPMIKTSKLKPFYLRPLVFIFNNNNQQQPQQNNHNEKLHEPRGQDKDKKLDPHGRKLNAIAEVDKDTLLSSIQNLSALTSNMVHLLPIFPLPVPLSRLCEDGAATPIFLLLTHFIRLGQPSQFKSLGNRRC